MNNTILLAFLACLSLHAASAQTIYVKQNATGDGSSWQNALGDLQQALAIATPNTEIWVAEGTYYPTQCATCTDADRSVSFTIPSKVRVLGGFKGNESREGQRNWKKHVTTLSGNIGQPGHADNSYTVVYTKNADKSTVVDGFVIAHGQADGHAAPGDAARSGAGWYNEGAGHGNKSNPFIMNCLFLENYAIEGAGLFNNGTGGEASPVLVSCVFSGNKSIYGGGGIFNNGAEGLSNPIIQECQFVNNRAAFGAGVFNACRGSMTEPYVDDCSFINNKAKVGGGLFYLGLAEEPMLRSSRFINNLSKDGEDVFVMKGRTIPGKLLASVEAVEEARF
ncbi:MAG: hypothetical protein H6577_25355 [Lewinellaceae bacterium]|nr:hypothetical protein [Lewinellaceae bacterium]